MIHKNNFIVSSLPRRDFRTWKIYGWKKIHVLMRPDQSKFNPHFLPKKFALTNLYAI